MTTRPQLVWILAAVFIGALMGIVADRYVEPLNRVVTATLSRLQVGERAGAPASTGTALSQAPGRSHHDEGPDGHKSRDAHGEDETPSGRENETKHEAHDPHEKNGEHDAHDGHGDERVVKLHEAEQKEFRIQLETAGPGTLQIHLSLTGEVNLNADRLAHVVPRVSGIVRRVNKHLGDRVRAGDVMAVLDSRELADAQSAYLAATERLELAQTTFQREADLWQKKITSEQEYLAAKQALADARIAQRTAEQKLHALGFSPAAIARLPGQSHAALTRYAIQAPFDGVVIEKHITLGEVLQDDTPAFVVADLETVWVDLKVYRKDLPFVRSGQSVVVSAGQGIPDAEGVISYVGPVVGEQTRTALARVVLPNPDGRWRPGLFVTGKVMTDALEVAIRIPKSALQTVDDKTVVFVETDEGFEPRAVTLGRRNETDVEVTGGLEPGETYVTRGAFTLKAQLAKGSFGDGHAH